MRSAREIPAQAELERGTLVSKMNAMARRAFLNGPLARMLKSRPRWTSPSALS
jgi:hypothetical protein